MKMLDAEQTRKADAYTIEHEPIASIDLMERASVAFTNWFVRNFNPQQTVAIFCGTGNNGGDGLAVARLLLERQYQVNVFVVSTSGRSSADFDTNRSRLKGLTQIHEIRDVSDWQGVLNAGIVIDALFGSGLARPITGLYADVIHKLNQSDATRVSVDIASGLYVDHHTDAGAIFEPHYTVSFQIPKLSCLLPQNDRYVGDWYVVDIGLNQSFIEQQDTPYIWLDMAMIRRLFLPRSPRARHSHKGTYGKAIIMAGSMGKMGAAALCAKAALRTGLGLLTLHIPECGYQIMQSTVPEAMASTDAGEAYISEVPDLAVYDAIGVGPGIDQQRQTVEMLERLLKRSDKPLVLDADALNIIAAHRHLLEVVPSHSILTPHPKEFERLVGSSKNDFERLDLLQRFSDRYNLYVVLKGAYTAIATPDNQVFFNSTGNPGMATGGSGDVLTGTITSLLAQGYEPKDAALFGVFLHGLSGDKALAEIGEEALIASDIIDYIPAAFKEIKAANPT
ncbi:MAG: NAD(P)H-hydrate dehydratase [Bacteroidota bacterium]